MTNTYEPSDDEVEGAMHAYYADSLVPWDKHLLHNDETDIEAMRCDMRAALNAAAAVREREVAGAAWTTTPAHAPARRTAPIAGFMMRTKAMFKIPYPLCATKLSIDFNPFGFWLIPRFRFRHLTEAAKEQGELIWYARWAWFQISYSRWI